MENLIKNKNSRSLKLIFFIQIGLLCLLAALFIVGYSVNNLEIGAFFFAIILGTLGSSISLMKRIRFNDIPFNDEFHELKNYAILMPILYGTLLSGVAYLLFMSGILSGENGNGILTTNLFPNFSKTKIFNENLLEQFIEMKPKSMQDTGKLLVWCFIAGYSERFVVGVLDQLEKKSSIS